jgi:hypothetical protein
VASPQSSNSRIQFASNESKLVPKAFGHWTPSKVGLLVWLVNMPKIHGAEKMSVFDWPTIIIIPPWGQENECFWLANHHNWPRYSYTWMGMGEQLTRYVGWGMLDGINSAKGSPFNSEPDLVWKWNGLTRHVTKVLPPKKRFSISLRKV